MHQTHDTMSLLSEKDLQLIKYSFRNALEAYYDRKNDENALTIIHANNLIKQIISSRQQSQSLHLISILEILKLKSKSHHSEVAKELTNSVETTIIHLKNPEKLPIKNQTLIDCIDNFQLNSIALMILNRLYAQMQGKQYDWKSIIQTISKHHDRNVESSVDVLILLLKDHQHCVKDVTKSGYIKYIFSVYANTVIKDKNSVYKVLKLLKIVSEADRTILYNREKYASNIIFTHSIYIPIIRQITEECFQGDYSNKILQMAGKQSEIDALYVWTYNSRFCDLATQQTINSLEKLHQEKGQGIDIELEHKIFAILANLVKNRPQMQLNPHMLKNPPMHVEKNLGQFLKMVENACAANPHYFDYVDFKTIDYVYNKFVGSDPVYAKLIANIKKMKNEPHQVGNLRASLIDAFSGTNHTEQMFQAISKRPRNHDLDKFRQVLNKRQGNLEEYEHHSLRLVKDKAIQTLRDTVAHKEDFNFWSVLEGYDPENPKDLNNLFRILELYLAINPDRVDEINPNKLLELIKWLEDNHGICIIDWVAISQILTFMYEDDEWEKHIHQIPKHCFWMLNAKDGPASKKLIQKLNSINPAHKLPIIIGFIGKTNDHQLKDKLLQQTKLLPEIVKRIQGYGRDDHRSELNQYLISVLNASYYIFDWPSVPAHKKIQTTVIEPILTTLYKVFQGTDHEIKFLQNSLPHPIKISALPELAIGRVMETNGKLAAWILAHQQPKKHFDNQAIENIGSESNANKIEQTLKFLEEHPDLIDKDEVQALIRQLDKGKKYWQLYPHYVSILIHTLSIASKTSNRDIMGRLTEILIKIIDSSSNNEELTNEELEELYEELYKAIDRLKDRKIRFDSERIKREAQKITIEQWRDKIILKLKEFKREEPIQLEVEKSELKEIKEVQYTRDLGPEEKIQNQNVNIVEILEEEHREEELTLIKAFRMLKKIVDKEEDKSKLNELLDVFMENDLNKKHRYLLGHLLTDYYSKIEKDPVVIRLLKVKDKTNLNRQKCYRFISDHEEAMSITRRWRLVGREFIDLAIQRIQCTNQYKEMCVDHGCQICEYNLVKTTDNQYFRNRQYHQVVSNIKIDTLNEVIPYLLLIGTSARLTETKQFYIKERMHLRIGKVFLRAEWTHDERFIANLSYALSSLVYTQNQIALEVVKMREELLRLLAAYKHFSNVKIVVESGCSLISNLCYSNSQTKQILYSYGIVELLVCLIQSNIEHPEISTFKLIMRAVGNMSLHKQSSEKFIDSRVTESCVVLVHKLNIFIHKDEEKIKVLKLVTDFLSNISSLKYHTHKMHQEGATDMIVTLLETTEIKEDKILMGCVDTIDGLCQLDEVENYLVMDKKLPYLLIDLLKVKEDEKLLTKAIRLLANLTINQNCIPYIMQANLLSVLANIVLPVYRNQKIENYVAKVLFRIYSAEPEMKLILKSGFLDCLIKMIEVTENLENTYIDILLSYSKNVPNYLNNRAFFAIIRLLSSKYEDKNIVEKGLRALRAIFITEEKAEEDILIEGTTRMYDKLLSPTTYNDNVIFTLGIHCIKSKKFKAKLIVDHEHKTSNVINTMHKLLELEATRDLATAVLFAILNRESHLLPLAYRSPAEEEKAFKTMRKGFRCKLYRVDGSYKSAKIDIDDEYNLRAYKHPDGELKAKYILGIRQIKDWQFDFSSSPNSWKSSPFTKEKNMFNQKTNMTNCATILGSPGWPTFNIINIEFESAEEKLTFVGNLSSLIMVFR